MPTLVVKWTLGCAREPFKKRIGNYNSQLQVPHSWLNAEESRDLLRESNPCEFPLSVWRLRRFSRNLVSTIQPDMVYNFLESLYPPPRPRKSVSAHLRSDPEMRLFSSNEWDLFDLVQNGVDSRGVEPG